MNAIRRAKKVLVSLLAIWLTATTALVYGFTLNDRIAHAVLGMAVGLVVLWVFVCGALMFFLRESIRSFVLRIPVHWQVKFVVFAILLAMIEEAVTTLMTNLAPVFGVAVGEAYITASTDYFDVILHHSVIVFVPMFIAWAWLLRRVAFSPFQVFLLFGLNGLMAECLTFGLQHLGEFALWIFVYGLMIYLPAYTLPHTRDARPARAWHALAALVLPFLFGIPWAVLIGLIFPNHPSIHFPPLQVQP